MNNCRCETKKFAALIETDECDVETDEIKNVSEYKAFPKNKTIYWCKYFISLCFNNIKRNNDLFLSKIKE